MHCALITGHAKGNDFHTGHKFSTCKDPITHTWNAVCIEGDWQLVDSHWGARYTLSGNAMVPDTYVGGGKNYLYDDYTMEGVGGGSKFIYELNEFYFLMEPQQAIYSHLPCDHAWTLLPTGLQISIEQFEYMPVLKSQFFFAGIDLFGNHRGTFVAKDGINFRTFKLYFIFCNNEL